MDKYIKVEDAVEMIHAYFCEEMEHLLAKYDDETEDYVITDMATCNQLLAHNKRLSKLVRIIPAADVVQRVCRTSRRPSDDFVKVVRCKDCKWFGDIGCAIRIVDDSDRPSENDFCSFAERKDNG